MFNRLFGSASAAETHVHVASADEVRRWLEAGEVVLVDVREADEHAAESIPGAISLPLSSFDPAQLPPVPEGKRLVFHCRSGVRCGTAAERARTMGYRGDIYRLNGGLCGWKAAGGSTV